jgi:hypothetical protein
MLPHSSTVKMEAATTTEMLTTKYEDYYNYSSHSQCMQQNIPNLWACENRIRFNRFKSFMHLYHQEPIWWISVGQQVG